MKIYQARLRRTPTQAESEAARDILAKGTSARDLEILVEESAQGPPK